MRIQKIVFASLSVALLCIGSATVAHADTIAFVGSRDVFNVPFATPNTGRCGAPAPPNLLATLPPGAGTSNLGAFTTTESHCINVATRVISDGQFTFDFGGGNSFFGTYVGMVSPPVDGVVPISQAFTVTGGTGLFTGAGGSFIGTGARIEANGMANIHLDFTGTINTVPEPMTLVLLGTGLAGVAVKARRRHKVKGSSQD